MRTLKQTKVKGRGALGDFGNALLTVTHMGAGTPEAAGAVTYGICLFVCPQRYLGALRMNLLWVWSLRGLSLSAFFARGDKPDEGQKRFVRRFAPCKIRAFRLLLSPTPQTQRRRQEQALPPQQWRILIFVLCAFCCRPAERTLTSVRAALIRNGCPAENYSALAINCATRSARRAALSTGSPSIILAC